MFEKEAEEYAKRSCFTEYPNPSLSEDIDISDEIKEAVLYGYNKAAEWHYPAKGELPDKDVECLVLTKSGNKLIAMIDSADNCWCTGAFFSEYLSDNCIACWQYFVPPEGA